VVYLQSEEGGETWRTPVESGRLEAIRARSASTGSQGLFLHLVRADYWELTTLTSVPLTNRHGAAAAELTLYNHSDAAHDDFAKIDSAGVAGGLPTPAWLRLVTGVNGCTYYVGQAVTSDVDYTYVLEAEDGVLGAGVAGADTADANCSAGNYVPLGWNGAAAVTLEYWDLGAATTGKLRGRIYQPVLRLRDLVSAGEKFWLWWRVGFNVAGTVENIQDFEGVLCSTSQKLVACPPMPVPPWPRPATGWAWESATLSLMCQAEGAGAHVLNLDFVQLLPTEGWLKLVPVVSTVTDSKVLFDAGTGTVTRSATGMASHVPEGPGLTLYPGVAQTVFVLSHSSGAMLIATTTEIKIQYRERKRTL
jgi:hypothetical protein